MNLQPQAESEKERRTRSKLEPHREAIFALRRKHWTYGQIAKWLNEHGVPSRSVPFIVSVSGQSPAGHAPAVRFKPWRGAAVFLQHHNQQQTNRTNIGSTLKYENNETSPDTAHAGQR